MDSIAAMAVSTVDEHDRETHQILFVNNEGELISNSSITHDYEANTFEWQPNGRTIAIGWADGTCLFYYHMTHIQSSLLRHIN